MGGDRAITPRRTRGGGYIRNYYRLDAAKNLVRHSKVEEKECGCIVHEYESVAEGNAYEDDGINNNTDVYFCDVHLPCVCSVCNAKIPEGIYCDACWLQKVGKYEKECYYCGLVFQEGATVNNDCVACRDAIWRLSKALEE